jgi:hypothetical protein
MSGAADKPLADAALAMSLSASQLELALRESDGPVDKLGSAIERLAAVVAELASTKVDGEAAVQPGSQDAVQWLASRVQTEVAACVESLQFYDHLVQHINHVRDFMATNAELINAHLPEPVVAKAPSMSPDQDAWDVVRVRLRTRLISEEQKELFDLLVAPETRSPPPLALLSQVTADEGSVELF